MDTFSHGLWGGLVFGRKVTLTKRQKISYFLLALLLGMAPDLLSFGPHFLTWALAGFPAYPVAPGMEGAPAVESLPAYVVPAYNITHSLLVWFASFLLLRLMIKKWPWVFGAWGFHILCDIPTHTTLYFPTPFLWPFDTPYVNGIAWGNPYFMTFNYGLLALISISLIWRGRRARKRIFS